MIILPDNSPKKALRFKVNEAGTAHQHRQLQAKTNLPCLSMFSKDVRKYKIEAAGPDCLTLRQRLYRYQCSGHRYCYHGLEGKDTSLHP